jgi:transducin (beta)-like 1
LLSALIFVSLINLNISVCFFKGELEVEEDYCLLQPLELISKDVGELQEIIKKRKRDKMEGEREKQKGKGKEAIREHERHAPGERERYKHERERDHVKERDKEREREREDREKEKEKQHLDRPEKARPTEDRSGGGKTYMSVNAYGIIAAFH